MYMCGARVVIAVLEGGRRVKGVNVQTLRKINTIQQRRITGLDSTNGTVDGQWVTSD